MAEEAPRPPAGEGPAAPPEPAIERHALRRRLSFVWLVPIVALIVGLVMLGRAALRSGPDIEIELSSAEGLEPGRTEVRFREVVVGRVTGVKLTDDRRRVLASVSLDRSVSQLAVADTRFWVVKPRIGAAGVSGLGTLFSGAYIGVDAGASEESRERFVALDSEPVPLRGEPGRAFVLTADDLGSLEVGSPVYYRRARVGRVVGYTLDAPRDRLDVRVFIEAPYEPLVTTQSRFWNASGIDVAVDANGLSVNAQSIASVVAGGLAFASPDYAAGAPAAVEGHRFELFATPQKALAPADGEPVTIRMLFDRSVRGLAIGAPVDLLGLEVGTVRGISLPFDRSSRRFLVEVTAEVYPLRIGNFAARATAAAAAAAATASSTAAAASAADKAVAEAGLAIAPGGASAAGGRRAARAASAARAAPAQSAASAAQAASSPAGASTEPLPVPDRRLLRRLVDNGLRAQVRTGNLLTGQLYVALDFVPKAQAVEFDADATVPILPTVPGTLSDLQQQLADIVERIGKVPFDRIAGQLQDTLAGADAASRSLTKTLDSARGAIDELSPEAKSALGDVRKTLAAAQSSLEGLERSVGQPGAPLQRNANEALIEMRRAAQALRVLSEYLQQHPQTLLRGKPDDPAPPVLPPAQGSTAAPSGGSR